MSEHLSLRPTLPVLLAAGMLLAGCSRQEFPVVFEPNLVHSMKYQIKEGIEMDQATKDAAWVTTEMFGTPDEPKIPDFVSEDEELGSILSIDRLTVASGPEDAEGRGLYRKHCVICHGVTGNGRGPTAAVQIPYPRDYRMGIFKFKSTPRGVKPTRDDLTRVIQNGVSGTAMKKIPELSEEDVQALVDYVIYLSWRGQLERILIDDGVRELDLEGGDRITNRQFGERLLGDSSLREKVEELAKKVDGDDLADYSQFLTFSKRLANEPGLEKRLEEEDDDKELDPDVAEQLEEDRDQLKQYKKFAEKLAADPELEAPLKEALSEVQGDDLQQLELFDEAWEYNVDYVKDIGESWLKADDDVVEVPQPPEGLPLAGSYAEYQQLSRGNQATALAASVQRGQELFVGKIATCSKCHGEKGLGNGQTADYDDWTKDWTVRVDLKPDDRDSLIPLLARGALPPVNAIPRNFQEGIFRGGASSEDLYRRITQGIDGTPMPAATFVDGQFEKDDVWHLINFVRSLQTTDAEEEPPTSEPAPAA